MSAGKSLWGDITNLDEIKPPCEILEEQGGFLKDLTNGVLSLSVEQKSNGQGQVFNYDVYLVPSRNKNRKRIFQLKHDTMFYPAMMHCESSSEEHTGKDQCDFEEKLALVLQSEEVKQSISLFMVQDRLAKANNLV